MNIIIFGANGQDGHYLNELFLANNITVIGVSRSGEKWLKADITNRNQTNSLIKFYKPEYIFHLAANSTTRHDALFENYESISTGTLNILEAVKRYCPFTKVFISGSGLQFFNTGVPISEHDKFEASSAYSMARIQSVYGARYYRSLGIPVYVGYLFHHESPYRKCNHISKKIALAVQRISKGSNEFIEIGDILVEKEWTFAGDVARGMITLVKQDKIFETVIGSGVAYSIENWLAECFKIIGKDWRNHTRLLHDFTPEYKRLISNPSTIFSLGWRPSVGFAELAQIMVNIQ